MSFFNSIGNYINLFVLNLTLRRGLRPCSGSAENLLKLLPEGQISLDCAQLHKQVLLVCVVSGVVGGALFAADGAFKYNAKGKRDPFVPLVSGSGSLASDAYEASAVEDIRLEGIVWDDVKGSIAIINGEIVKEGDLIGSIKVLKIDKQSVIFVVDGESVEMDLNKE